MLWQHNFMGPSGLGQTLVQRSFEGMQWTRKKWQASSLLSTHWLVDLWHGVTYKPGKLPRWHQLYSISTNLSVWIIKIIYEVQTCSLRRWSISAKKKKNSNSTLIKQHLLHSYHVYSKKGKSFSVFLNVLLNIAAYRTTVHACFWNKKAQVHWRIEEYAT